MTEIESAEVILRTLTPKVALLVSNRNHALPRKVGLSEAEKSHLKALLRCKSPLPKHIRLSKAMTALAQEERGSEVATLLAGVLGARSMDPMTRSVAATLLKFMPREDAELSLMANIGAEHPLVLAHVIQSLGCIGKEHALTHLESLGAPREPYLRKQLAFSKALIQHRLNLPGDPLPFQEGVKRTKGRDEDLLGVSLRRMTSASLRKCRQHLQGCTYELDLSNELGFEFIVGESRFILFCNREIEAAGLPHALVSRKWIFGLLTLENQRARALHAQHIVLTKPSENEVLIQAVRTDGEVCYTGRAGAKGDTIAFSLRDVDRPGTAPTNIEGRLTPEGILFDHRIAFRKRIEKRTAEAVIV